VEILHSKKILGKQEVKELDCILGIDEEVAQTTRHFSSMGA